MFFSDTELPYLEFSDGIKTCAKCKDVKSTSEFSPNNRDKPFGRLSSYCKTCRRDHQRYKSKDLQKEEKKQYNKNRREEKRLFLLNYKTGKFCSDCQRSFPSECLDFDHVRSPKIVPVSKMVGMSTYSIKDMLDEIDKCELVCANCHRTRTLINGYGTAHKIKDKQK